MNSEEVDLQLRLRQLGLPSVVLSQCPTLVLCWRRFLSSDKRRQWLVDSRFIYADKWHGPSGVDVAARERLATELAFFASLKLPPIPLQASNLASTQINYPTHADRSQA